MSFSELAASRYSVRKFAPRPVEDACVRAVLEAGRLAPTAKNLQPQRVYVLQSDEAVARIREITPCAYNAPVVFMICGNVPEAWVNPFSNVNHAETDVAIVTCHMMLRAAELGLGSVWVGRFDPARIREVFQLPEGVEPFALLPVGYPAEDAEPGPNHASRKPLEDTVTYL